MLKWVKKVKFCSMARLDSIQKSLFRAYTLVREYFELNRNTAIGQKMAFLSHF